MTSTQPSQRAVSPGLPCDAACQPVSSSSSVGHHDHGLTSAVQPGVRSTSAPPGSVRSASEGDHGGVERTGPVGTGPEQFERGRGVQRLVPRQQGRCRQALFDQGGHRAERIRTSPDRGGSTFAMAIRPPPH
jgi:hypothetical protein